MSNRYTRAMNTRNAVRASRPTAGRETVPVEPDPSGRAPGTTHHPCLLPRHDPYTWAGDIRYCADCGREWIAVGRRWDGHNYLIRWAAL